MEKATLTWQVTEDNGGGLTLYVWEGDTLIYAHAGYEYTEPQQLLDDLANLAAGEHPVDNCWDGNDLVDEDIVRGIRQAGDIYDSEGFVIPLTHDEYYVFNEHVDVICDEDGPIDTDDMGAAGRRVFEV